MKHPLATAIITVAILLSLINAFAFTSTAKIMEWDEARRGVTAYEMLKSGDFLTQRYRGEVDLWSTKPPLGLWAIALSYKCFGYNRFALRFPSGVCAVLTVLLVAWLGARLFGPMEGGVAALVLATTPPFFLEHSACAGEYDPPLAFLIALFFSLIVGMRPGVSRAVAAGVVLGSVFLLKSFAVIIPVAIILGIGVIARRRFHFQKRELYILIATALILPGIWIAARWSVSGTNFFSAMIANDLLGRTLSAVEGHQQPWYWYVTRIVEKSPVWSALFFIGLGLSFKQTRHSLGTALATCWSLVPLLGASCIPTKLAWYINPVFPGVSLAIAGWSRSIPVKAFLALLVIGVAVSETLIVRRILSSRKLPEFEQAILKLELPHGSQLPAAQWSQAAYFVARVERGYIPVTSTASPADQHQK